MWQGCQLEGLLPVRVVAEHCGGWCSLCVAGYVGSFCYMQVAAEAAQQGDHENAGCGTYGIDSFGRGCVGHHATFMREVFRIDQCSCCVFALPG